MSRRAGILLGSVLLVILAGLLALRMRAHAKPLRVEVETGHDWAGFSVREREGLVLVLSDLLELGGATLVTGLPQSAPLPPRTGRLQLQARREGATFRLLAHWTGPKGREREIDLAGEDLRGNLLKLISQLNLASAAGEKLLPSASADLLPLAECLAITYNGGDGDLEQLATRLESLSQREPDCPLASLEEGMASYRLLLSHTPSDMERQARSRQAFQRSLALLPDYPRAITQYSFYLTDTGEQREALERLFETTAVHPGASGLQSAIAYAARTSGLLEGARAALLKQERLQGFEGAASGTAENTWLYLGDQARFEKVLGSGSDELPDPIGDFYRGYLRLLQGRSPESVTYFKRSEEAGGNSPQFSGLAKVYRLALEGRGDEARALLRELESVRTQLRVPDGEYTFKLAEAHAYLGDLPEALESSLRAASQGFGCTAWYERSPLLRPLQPMPRWKALLQHLQGRQRLMEARFPLQNFGF